MRPVTHLSLNGLLQNYLPVADVIYEHLEFADLVALWETSKDVRATISETLNEKARHFVAEREAGRQQTNHWPSSAIRRLGDAGMLAKQGLHHAAMLVRLQKICDGLSSGLVRVSQGRVRAQVQDCRPVIASPAGMAEFLGRNGGPNGLALNFFTGHGIRIPESLRGYDLVPGALAREIPVVNSMFCRGPGNDILVVRESGWGGRGRLGIYDARTDTLEELLPELPLDRMGGHLAATSENGQFVAVLPSILGQAEPRSRLLVYDRYHRQVVTDEILQKEMRDPRYLSVDSAGIAVLGNKSYGYEVCPRSMQQSFRTLHPLLDDEGTYILSPGEGYIIHYRSRSGDLVLQNRHGGDDLILKCSDWRASDLRLRPCSIAFAPGPTLIAVACMGGKVDLYDLTRSMQGRAVHPACHVSLPDFAQEHARPVPCFEDGGRVLTVAYSTEIEKASMSWPTGLYSVEFARAADTDR